MKRLLFLFIAVLLLTACGNEEPREIIPASSQVDTEQDTTEQESAEQETADLKAANEKLKADSVEYDYVAYFRNEIPKDGKVKFTGEVSLVGKQGFGGEFTLEQDVPVENGETTRGIVKVENMNIGEQVEIVEGKTLTIYGIYTGKNEMKIPEIKAILIEE